MHKLVMGKATKKPQLYSEHSVLGRGNQVIMRSTFDQQRGEQERSNWNLGPVTFDSCDLQLEFLVSDW